MKEHTFVIFRQINLEYASKDDLLVTYIHGTRKQAQDVCNEYNSKNIGYFYFMDLDDVREELSL